MYGKVIKVLKRSDIKVKHLLYLLHLLMDATAVYTKIFLKSPPGTYHADQL